jgi:hypothetical protein
MEFSANNLINANGGQPITGNVKVKNSVNIQGDRVLINITYHLSDSWGAVKVAAIQNKEVPKYDENEQPIGVQMADVRVFMPNVIETTIAELGDFVGVNGLNSAVESIVLNAINNKINIQL